MIRNLVRSRSSPLYRGKSPNYCCLSQISRFSNNVISMEALHYNKDTGMITEENEEGGFDTLFHTVIGIEIHAQLAVPTKLFSSSPTKHHPELSHYTNVPNTSISLHDIGYPGTLPLLSKKSVQYAVLSAAALQCQIQIKSRFERKHYFYPDLPLGYQVTQQRWPLAKEGSLSCRRYIPATGKKRGKKTKKNEKKTSVPSDELSKFFTVGIARIQMEQDTGKTTTITKNSEPLSLIDFNRAGSALIEIVFKPQIKSAHEAASVASTVQSLLKHIGTCDGKMEDGSLRVDLNISIAPVDNSCKTSMDELIGIETDNPFQKYLPLGVGNRVEVKNLNSLRQIIQSVEFEGLRQARNRLDGDVINQETRTYDAKSGRTIKLRDKGGAVDYRFMPEPDLPPLLLNDNVLDGNNLEDFLSKNLPELPEEATNRLIHQYGITEASSIVITSDRPAITMFEEAVQVCKENLKNTIDDELVSVAVSNWLCNDLFSHVKESVLNKKTIDNSDQIEDSDESLRHPISMEYSNVNSYRVGRLVSLVLNEEVSSKQAKKLLEVMYKEDLSSDPKTIADERGWKLISDPTELKQLCIGAILNPENQKQLEQYKQGGKHVRKMKKFFVGKIMASSEGNAHPELLSDALDKALDELAPGVE